MSDMTYDIQQLASRVDRLEKSLDIHVADNKAAHKEMYARIGDHDKSKAETYVLLKNIQEKLSIVEKKLDSFVELPRKNVNDIKIALLCSVVSGIIMFIIGKLF